MSNEFDFEAMFGEVEDKTPEKETLIDPEVLENPNIKPVQAVTKPTMSFNKPKEVTKSDKPKRKFITKEIQIDKFNVKRTKVELTPSVCDICAFDVAAKHFGSWYQVPETEKEKIKKAVEEHKRVVHPLNQNLIVDEDEIPTHWLGQAR
jgi:hypothetical protein